MCGQLRLLAELFVTDERPEDFLDSSLGQPYLRGEVHQAFPLVWDVRSASY